MGPKTAGLMALALAAAACAAAAQTPAAAPGPMSPAERFKAADKNGDGKVDKAEFKATLNPDAQLYVDAVWANRDINKDGWLTEAELTANGAAAGGAGAVGLAPAPGRPGQ